MTVASPGNGNITVRAAREIPGILLLMRSPAASKAPVDPAEINPSYPSSRKAFAARTIDASFFLRIAIAGSSSLVI